MGVTELVHPGEVVGIDPDEDVIEQANDWMHESSPLSKVTYQVSDSHELDFPDDTFDVVYSHTVAHFFLDPIAAFKEQKRVAKPGGWVVASGVRQWVPSLRNPPCPNWNQLYEAHRLYDEELYKAFLSSGRRPAEYLAEYIRDHVRYFVYMDTRAASKCPGWLHDAGLTNLRVSVKAEWLQYQGSEYMNRREFDRIPPVEPSSPQEEFYKKLLLKRIEMGLLDAETVELAKEEADRWYQDPHAFNFNVLVFAAGQA